MRSKYYGLEGFALTQLWTCIKVCNMKELVCFKRDWLLRECALGYIDGRLISGW